MNQLAEISAGFGRSVADAIDGTPDYMHEGICNYLLRGVPCGDFLRAVVCNDLHEAFSRADMNNRAAMFDWARVLHEMPTQCWGSEERYQHCIDIGGLNGRRAAIASATGEGEQ